MTHGLFLVADSQYRIFSTESSQIAGSQATEAIGNDGTDRHQVSSAYGLFCEEAGYIRIFRSQRNWNIVFFHLIFFSLSSNLRHSLHSFYRIFTIRCFSTQHQRIGTIVDSIGDISNLSTSRTRIVDHGVQHLRSHDYRFLSQDTFLNQDTLNTRNAFLRHFNTQVTTSYHYTISYFQDFIDVIHTFLVFNLSNNLDVAVMCIQDFTNIKYILTIANK